ncbi:putative serine/threonine-protein kinase nek3-like protein [Leptotrombidium deliense]|uniref:Putative serine/threonine-protein kinase nek3-like protein n=1 Tax=Leptotrombidium deliense TaxID=299467 RepID=A0A443SMB9_9ACAR|nr:putative serine/threonine-protein kinase nek3-like protein [Leptotrombidium deliense]
MLNSAGISCHYYCLLFACGLRQGGEDEEGILGFLVDDIRTEARRGNRLNCRFCKKKGATSACAIPQCQVKFHIPCGLKNNILNQFFGNFNSFCPSHRPVQNIPLKFRSTNTDCSICYESISPTYPFYKELWTPCCKKWLHKDCIQKQAYSAGQFYFKCPLCNNEPLFKSEMRQFGIYAPEKLVR